MVDFNLNPEQQEQQQQQQQQPAPAPAPTPDQTEDYRRFEQYMRSYLGVDPTQIQAALAQQQQQTVEFQRQKLRQEWGEQYDENFASVQAELQEIAKTDPARAQALANADGALLLYRARQYDQLKAGGLQAGGLNRSTTPATAAKVNYQFTASQLREMTADERRANHDAIQAAYRNGLVDRNA